MLNENGAKKFESIGFRFKGKHQDDIVGIYTVGWEKVESTDYNWNGLQRREIGKYVFQYTLSGRGAIEVGGQTHQLSAGQAFLVEIPSKHRYYFPEDSSHWEFIHLTLFGKEIKNAFEFIQEKLGYVISFSPESTLIKMLLNIFEEAANKKITDGYQASALAYPFMMELYRFSQNMDSSIKTWPEPISKAALFAQKNYSAPIGLDDLVTASGLSKYHFTRLFHQTTNMTPLKYLTKIRIDKAIELLRQSDHSIEEIALQVGYSNGNYFSKVFNKRIGMSPGQFRENKHAIPVDHLLID